jgi:hypothetical protein
MPEYGELLCSFSFATTRWHLRFFPVHDVFLYDRAIAVVLTSSKPEFRRRGPPGAPGTPVTID